jgi:hypothetical protein
MGFDEDRLVEVSKSRKGTDFLEVKRFGLLSLTQALIRHNSAMVQDRGCGKAFLECGGLTPLFTGPA